MSEEDHEFKPVMICSACDELHEDCECDDTTPSETDECEVCGMSEASQEHQTES